MSDPEISAFLAESHTGILATLRADGSPAMTPMWFVVVDASVCVRTMAKLAKAQHIRRDPRVSFLVESGRAWTQLKAVVLYGEAEIVEDDGMIARIDEALAAKYADYGMPAGTPERTRDHYAAERAHVRIVPARTALTWDNAKLLSRGNK